MPKVEWFKDGQTVTRDIGYDNRLATLYIKETKETSMGRYTCKASNEVGSVETSCSLVIAEKPAIQVEQKLMNQKLKVGSQWSVVANLKGYPAPTITWMKNDAVIKSNSEITIVNKESQSIITINSTKRSCTGKYTIKVENNYGSDQVEINLRIFGEYNFHAFVCFIYFPSENINLIRY